MECKDLFKIWINRRDCDLVQERCVIAQLVEQVAVNHPVAGSSPAHAALPAEVVELVYTTDLKSVAPCGLAGSSPAFGTLLIDFCL